MARLRTPTVCKNGATGSASSQMERISSAGLRELRMTKRAILTEQGQFDQKQFGFRRIDAFPFLIQWPIKPVSSDK